MSNLHWAPHAAAAQLHVSLSKPLLPHYFLRPYESQTPARAPRHPARAPTRTWTVLALLELPFAIMKACQASSVTSNRLTMLRAAQLSSRALPAFVRLGTPSLSAAAAAGARPSHVARRGYAVITRAVAAPERKAPDSQGAPSFAASASQGIPYADLTVGESGR